jgi:hypothetical protein
MQYNFEKHMIHIAHTIHTNAKKHTTLTLKYWQKKKRKNKTP